MAAAAFNPLVACLLGCCPKPPSPPCCPSSFLQRHQLCCTPSLRCSSHDVGCGSGRGPHRHLCANHEGAELRRGCLCIPADQGGHVRRFSPSWVWLTPSIIGCAQCSGWVRFGCTVVLLMQPGSGDSVVRLAHLHAPAHPAGQALLAACKQAGGEPACTTQQAQHSTTQQKRSAAGYSPLLLLAFTAAAAAAS